MTVENLTSFSELTHARPPDALVIYTGGFASPTVIGLLAQIREASPEVPIWHWGDIDAGGLRILGHLRRQMGAVRALGMHPELLEIYQNQTRPLTGHDRDSLRELRHQLALSDCELVIDAMLKLDRKLQQEALSAEQVVASLC